MGECEEMRCGEWEDECEEMGDGEDKGMNNGKWEDELEDECE